MASVAAAEGEHQEEDANDEDRAIDPALLEPPASSSYRCVLDRQGALVHWASQRGKVCAAAVVAGAIDSLWQRQEAVTVELALREFQGAWRAAIRELSTTPDSHEKAALLTRLTASYQKLAAPDRADASTACVGIPQLTSALIELSRARGLPVTVGILMDREQLQKTDPDGAWRRIWEAFVPGKDGSGSVLILHMPRHYALVFGLREYQPAAGGNGGARMRKVLTARKKQKPKEWLDFDECIVPLMQGPDGGRCHIVLVQRCTTD